MRVTTKRSASLIAIAAMTIIVFLPAIRAQPGYMLTGRWRTPEGGIVEISKTGTHVTATFDSGGDCPFGAKRTTYFEAEVTGTDCSGILDRSCRDVLKGSMERCTMSEELLKVCDLAPVYTIYFEAKGSSDVINVTWKNEHYSGKTDDKSKDGSAGQNGNNDAKKQCKWTRDPSGDKNMEFTLSRYAPYHGGKKCMGRRCG